MPKILQINNREYFEYAGAAGGFIDKYGFPFCRGRILNHLEKDTGQYDHKKDIFWATGACMFVKAELFHALGGLDPFFFAHMEEIDLCWRMKNQGYRVIFVPESKVYHVGGGTLPNEHPHKLYLNFRNNLLTLYKNIPPGRFSKIYISRLVIDFFASMKYLVSLKFRNFYAVLKAHINFLKHHRRYRTSRGSIDGKQYAITEEEIYKRSIIVDYFIRKKRKFSDLEFLEE
jgi:GT2 family glycosyltransferase